MKFSVAVLPGDGIGPEVTQESVLILDEIGKLYGHEFTYAYGPVGGVAIDSFGTALPAETAKIASKADAVLFGAVGGPKWDDPSAAVRPEDGILGIRRHLKLFANLRPVQVYPELLEASPIKPDILKGADFLVIRELTGGLYFGKPKKRWETKTGRQSVDTLKYSETEIRRIVRVAFELARGRRKLVTSVDKANVLETSRLWRQVATEVALDYPDVAIEHMLVDTAAMQLVSNPKRFDVVVTENMFGDILTDEAAVVSGSMGMLPSASLAGIPDLDQGKRTRGLYEPIHGSAPDIAGKGLANPTASILSAAFMLRYSLSLGTEAMAIESAVAEVLREGYRTADIAEGASDHLSTVEMGSQILRRIR